MFGWNYISDWFNKIRHNTTWNLQGYTDMIVDPVSGAIVPDSGQFDAPGKGFDITDSIIILGFGYLALQAYSEFRSPTKKSYKSSTSTRTRGTARYGKGSVSYG